jgi:hypothetical protein
MSLPNSITRETFESDQLTDKGRLLVIFDSIQDLHRTMEGCQAGRDAYIRTALQKNGNHSKVFAFLGGIVGGLVAAVSAKFF